MTSSIFLRNSTYLSEYAREASCSASGVLVTSRSLGPSPAMPVIFSCLRWLSSDVFSSPVGLFEAPLPQLFEGDFVLATLLLGLLQSLWQQLLHSESRFNWQLRHSPIFFFVACFLQTPAALHWPSLHFDSSDFSKPSVISLIASLSSPFFPLPRFWLSFFMLATTASRSFRVIVDVSIFSSSVAALSYLPSSIDWAAAFIASEAFMASASCCSWASICATSNCLTASVIANCISDSFESASRWSTSGAFISSSISFSSSTSSSSSGDFSSFMRVSSSSTMVSSSTDACSLTTCSGSVAAVARDSVRGNRKQASKPAHAMAAQIENFGAAIGLATLGSTFER